MSEGRLRLFRLAWGVVVGLPLIATLASWPVYFALLLRPCSDCLIKPDMVRALNAAGLSIPLWAAWRLVGPVVVVLISTGVGLLVFWRRREDPRIMSMAALLPLVGLGLGGFQFDLATFRPEWWFVSRSIQVVSTTSLFILTLVLPTGRIAPRWTVWPIVYLVALNAYNQFVPTSPLAFGNWPMPWVLALFFAPLLISMIAIPVYRYRHILSHVERQQIKWIVVGIALYVACIILLLFFSATCQSAAGPAQILRCGAVETISYSSTLLIPTFIGVAILRSRLWDIDVIIRRTLVYAVLSGLLALLYFGSVVLFEGVLRGLIGGSSQAAIVLSTLLIAALFGPLRGRVQRAIDRRFYRRKYDAARTLAAFGASVRDDVDLDALGQRLTAVVDETMQPTHIRLWAPAKPQRPKQL